MRDISELIDQKPPPDKVTPEELRQQAIAEDVRLMNTFGRHETPQRPGWGIGRRWT